MESLSQDLRIPILVANSAINGRTTRIALENMPFEIQSHRPEILLVQFGLNDCNVWATDGGLPRVSPRAFAANVTEIIDRALGHGSIRVLLNTNHPTLRSKRPTFPDPGYDSRNRQYNELLREAIQSYAAEVQLIDIESRFDQEVALGTDLRDLLNPDGLHLSLLGHQIYEQLVLPILGTCVETVGQINPSQVARS
jgi:acyl-CoA thioesterase-1